MSKKQKNRKQTDSSNVEFGQEFGDVNASKFFDTEALTKEKVKGKARRK